jgi:CHAT domain-containing protein
MESAGGDCSLPPKYEALELSRYGGDQAAALTIADQAAEVFAAAGSRRGLAAVALHRSHAAFLRGDFAAQMGHADEAAEHARVAGDGLLRSAASVHRVVAGIGAGSFGGHELEVRSVGRWGRRSGSFSHALGLGLVLTRLGRFWLMRQSDPDRARTAISCAEELFQALGANQNAVQCHAEMARVQGWLGMRTIPQARLRAAVDDYLRDAGLGPMLRSPALRRARDLAGTLLAQAHNSPDPAVCRAAADIAERVLRAAGPVPNDEPADLLAQGRTDEFEVAIYARQLSRAVPQARYAAHLLAARAARAGGDRATHAREVEAALGIARSMPFPASAFYQAAAFGVARHYDEAETAYLAYLSGGGHDATMGDLLAPMRRFATAGAAALDARAHANDRDAAQFFANIRRFSRAAAHLAAVERLAGEGWWGKEDQPWAARALTGQIAEGLGEISQALHAYDEAVGLFETDLGRLLRDDQRTAFTDRRHVRMVYLASARTVLASGSASDTEAFNRVDRGRARALGMLVATTDNSRRLAAKEADLVRRWRETAARADALANAEAAAGAPPSSPLAQEAARMRDELTALDDQVRRRRGDLAVVLNPTVPPVTAEEISRSLPAGSVLLTWAHVDDDLLAFILPAGEEPRCHRATIDTDDLTALLGGFAVACRSGTAWEQPAAQVADLLLTPFAGQLRPAAAVIVAPFLAGHRVPFHLLPLDGEALGARKTLSQLPTTAIIRHLADPSQSGRKPLAAQSRLVVGNPARMAWAPPGGGDRQAYPELKYAEVEALAVARPGDASLVASAATRECVLRELPLHGILHFATHAHTAADAAQLSAVLLADGAALSVADLLGSGLQADLVVLSACDTGTGTLTDGDEVVGLTRSLFAAGARQAVVSLWPANDLSTCLLMRRLYGYLDRDIGVAEALRRARLEVAALGPADQADELLEIKEQLAERGAGEDVLEPIDAAVTARGGTGSGRLADDFKHPRTWAPFVHSGLP